MRRFITLAALLSAFVLAPTATAGGPFVTALNAPPADLSAGAVWHAKLRAVDCFGSRTETGIRPWIAIRNADTGRRIVFRARLAARRNGYEADYQAQVVFPEAGRWSYTVGDRSSEFKRYSVTVGQRSDSPFAQLSAGGAALLVLAAAGLAARRRSRRI